MATLKRQIDGSYLTDTGKNIGNLDMAAQRGNPQDLANVDYAKKNYGFTPSTPAGSNTGITNTNPALPTTGSLVPTGVKEPSDEADIFNLLTRDALLKFQGVNTADLEKKKRALQMTAIGRQSELTPEELRTFSPEQQASIRSGNIKALQPEFDDIAYQLNKAQQATANFENVFEKVSKISQEYAAKMVAPESVINNYKQLIEADPENINTYLAKVNDKTRDAIIQALDYEKLKPKQKLTKTTYKGKTTWYDEQGNIVKTEQSPITPTTPNTPTSPTPVVKLTPEQKAIQNEIEAEKKKLAKGGDWGTSWNYLKNRYPDMPNDVLDEALGKEQYYPKEVVEEDDKKWYEFWK